MKIAIFGCTADPFTPAHKNIVDKILGMGIFNKVLIVPTIVKYHREGKERWLTNEEKLKCLKTMLRSEIHQTYVYSDICCDVIVYDRELKLSEVCENDEYLKNRILMNRRFIDTLVNIKAEYGTENEYYVVIGTDSVINFKTWEAYEKILSNSKIIGVGGRDGVNKTDDDFVSQWIYVDKELENISASKIREKYNKLEDYLNDYRYNRNTIR